MADSSGSKCLTKLMALAQCATVCMTASGKIIKSSESNLLSAAVLTGCENERHCETLMDALQLFQVARQQSHRNLAQYFVDGFIESFANRKDHQDDCDIYDWRCRTCYAKPLLNGGRRRSFTNKNIENLVLADFVCFHTKNEPPGPTPSNFRR